MTRRKASTTSKGPKAPPAFPVEHHNPAGGRPSLYTPVLAERICALIAMGFSKRAIGDLPDMPNRSTIDEWLLRHEGFSSQYARACEIRAEGFAEEIVEISDRDDLDANDKKVRIDARKWTASKLLPRQYGESVTVKGDKDHPLQFKRAVDLSEAELLAIAAGERALDG